MDENSNPEGGDQPAATLAPQKAQELLERLQRAEQLLGQIASLHQTISKELADLSSKIRHPFETSVATASRAGAIDASKSEREKSPFQAEAPDAAARAFYDSPSAVPSPGEDLLATVIPEVAFLSWGEMTTTLAGLAQYPTIEVSSDEPVGPFDGGSSWDGFSNPASITTTRRGLLPERIQINSPRLKALLKQIMGEDEASLGTSVDKPFLILRPFKMLFYHETSLTNALDGSSEEFNDLRLLVSLMKSHLQPRKEGLQDVADTAAYSDLWYLFPPGSLIYVKDAEYAQKIWRVIQRTGGRRYLGSPDHVPGAACKHQLSPFIIDCYFLDFDGSQYVPVYGRFGVLPYHGVQSLISLSAFPLRIALKNGLVNQDDLASRGREFFSCTTAAHRYYAGWSHTRTPDGRKGPPESEEKFDSEVIVDFELAFEQRPDWRPLEKKPYLYDLDRSELGDLSRDVSQDWAYDKHWSDRVLAQLKETLHSLQDPQTKPDDGFLLLLPDRVLGFVPWSRKFGEQLCVQPEGWH